MTTMELQKRAEKSQALKCIRLKDGSFLVESSDGKIMYPVQANGAVSCTCADFQRNQKADGSFRCKHILSAMGCDDAEIAETAEKRKARINPEFIKNLQGREFVLYNGLVDLAHQKGLLKLEVEVIQYPSQENGHEAVCRAIAETKYGERFSDIGDASAKNCNKMIASHIIRMASTRAKARCLRDLTNVGMTCVEELGDLDEVISADNGKALKAAKPMKKDAPVKPAEPRKEETPAKVRPMPAKNIPTEKKPESGQVGGRISEAQKRALYNLGRRRGHSQQEIEDMVKTSFGVPVDDLNQAQASQFIRTIQTAA